MSTRTHSGPVRCLLVTLLVALGLAGCGIPKDSGPRLIAEEPGLSPTSPPAIEDPSGSRSVTLFFIDTEPEEPVLADLERTTKPTPTPMPFEAVLRLLSGTTDDEEGEGLISRIPEGTELLLGTSTIEDGLATLDLSAEIADITGPNAVQAYAQLVFTVTDYPVRVKEVRFLIEGELDNVPTLDQGDLPIVTRSNYQELAPA